MDNLRACLTVVVRVGSMVEKLAEKKVGKKVGKKVALKAALLVSMKALRAVVQLEHS